MGRTVDGGVCTFASWDIRSLSRLEHVVDLLRRVPWSIVALQEVTRPAFAALKAADLGTTALFSLEAPSAVSDLQKPRVFAEFRASSPLSPVKSECGRIA